jgi:hypothetical protein
MALSRRRAGGRSIAAGLGLLTVAAALLPTAQAGSCRPGCVATGTAIFDPFAPDDGPGYTLMHTADGHAVRYDPCSPIHYVVNAAGAPSGWRGDITGALDRIASATGLRFVDDGATAEMPAAGRRPYQPDRYGPRWAPVLVAWAREGATTLLPRGAAGDGGSMWARSSGGPPVLVTGTVVLDADLAPRLPNGFADHSSHGRLLAHELGHLVGLGHSHDPAALMAPKVGWDPSVLAPGDLAGLRQVGAARGCLPVPRPG